jgi:hypothetical protein
VPHETAVDGDQQHRDNVIYALNREIHAAVRPG